jgi:hypothetical protein
MSDDNLGSRFAHAFAAKDAATLHDLLHPDVDFRGLTPNNVWEAADAEAAVAILIGAWLEDTDHVTGLDHVETDRVGARERAGYRLSVTNPDGDFVFEQQAYLGERDGRIDWMRIVCSGFQPA